MLTRAPGAPTSLSASSPPCTHLSCPTTEAEVISERHQAISCFRHFSSSHHTQNHAQTPYLSLQGPVTSGHSLPLHITSHGLFLVPWALASGLCLFPERATPSPLRAWALAVPSVWTSTAHVSPLSSLRSQNPLPPWPCPDHPVRCGNPFPVILCRVCKSFFYLFFPVYCSIFPTRTSGREERDFYFEQRSVLSTELARSRKSINTCWATESLKLFGPLSFRPQQSSLPLFQDLTLNPGGSSCS